MKRKIIYLTLITFFLTGCYNYRELNDLAIIDALGIDYQNNKFLVTAQVLNVEKKETDSAEKLIVVYQAEGKSIAEAINNMSLDNPKEMYLGHLELIIFGESLTKDNLDKAFEFLLRDPHVRSEALVVASYNNSAREILNQKVNSNIFPSKSIINSIEISSKIEGTVIKETLEDLIKLTLDKNIDPVITTISIEKENEGKENINEYNLVKLNNLGIIKSKKIVDYLEKDEAIAYNIIKNNIKDVIISIPFEDENSVIGISEPISNINLKLKNNKINITLKVNLSGNIIEMNKRINTNNRKVLEDISATVNEKVKDDITSLLEKCRKNDIDILGLKNIIYKKHNKEYKKYKDKNIYEISNFNIEVTSQIYKEGNTYQGI